MKCICCEKNLNKHSLCKRQVDLIEHLLNHALSNRIDRDKLENLYFNTKRTYDKFAKRFSKQLEKKSKDKNKYINAKWEDMTMKFLNGEEVEVMHNKLGNQRLNYNELGFENKKTKLPNKQWELLRLISETNGVISWKNNIDINNPFS